MKLVIPMAGKGRRFLDAGETRPKMLIPIDGKLMVEWALLSLADIPKKDWIFVVLKEHVLKWELDRVLTRLFGDEINLVEIPEVTDGQARTVALAKSHYEPDELLVIYNTDTYFKSHTLSNSLDKLRSGYDGLIGVFNSTSPSYSFVKLADGGLVSKVAEKEPLSNWATTGLYAFARASDFLVALDSASAKKEMSHGEYYVAPLFNNLIEKGGKVFVDKASLVYDFGKPEKVADFLKGAYRGE